MLLSLDAHLECDACGAPFAVSFEAPHSQGGLGRVDLAACVEEAIATTQVATGGFAATRGVMQLCVDCAERIPGTAFVPPALAPQLEDA